jgi:hypothetical protein
MFGSWLIKLLTSIFSLLNAGGFDGWAPPSGTGWIEPNPVVASTGVVSVTDCPPTSTSCGSSPISGTGYIEPNPR